MMPWVLLGTGLGAIVWIVGLVYLLRLLHWVACLDQDAQYQYMEGRNLSHPAAD